MRTRRLALAIGLVIACGAPRLPAPEYTSHPTSALEAVPYPPPPARVEAIPGTPKSSKESAVWIDGEWVWRARRWVWQRGRWVVPPKGARFAPWTTVRDPRGTLYIARGTWRDDAGVPVPEPEPLAEPTLGPTELATEGEEDLDGGTMDAKDET